MIQTWPHHPQARRRFREGVGVELSNAGNHGPLHDTLKDSLTVMDEFERLSGLVNSLYSVLSQTDIRDRSSLEIAINSHFGLHQQQEQKP